MNIFFGELNYQTISQIKAYDFASLLGDIGGQMGLFIGIVYPRIDSFEDRPAKILCDTSRSIKYDSIVTLGDRTSVYYDSNF